MPSGSAAFASKHGHLFIHPILTIVLLLMLIAAIPGCTPRASEEIPRPEEIVSKRVIVYDQPTYDDLSQKWSAYYDAFPSEYAYANWMYAARYAKWDDYETLLKRGLSLYPANPTLLYLMSMTFGNGSEDALAYTERAIYLDPGYTDPYFNLVGEAMARGDDERTRTALAKLLEQGAVDDLVLDYGYNMLATLQPDAILITNGDNDTYPCWILQQELGIRTDVNVINRSLLNTAWYPGYVIERGAPPFIPLGEVDAFQAEHKAESGDQLILRIVDAAEKQGRPVYFAATMYETPAIQPLMEDAPLFGLSLLVSDPGRDTDIDAERERAARVILDEYRTQALQSWRTRYASKTVAAGVSISRNYFYATYDLATHLDSRTLQRDLFFWNRDNTFGLFDATSEDNMKRAWCRIEGVPEIRAWCEGEGYEE